MTEMKPKNLRVFCLCGQKMQVTKEMYGRPAKCVACHQKWFIPEESEISSETLILSLKEHPELLRMPGQLSRKIEIKADGKLIHGVNKNTTPPPITDVDLGVCFRNKGQQIDEVAEKSPANNYSPGESDSHRVDQPSHVPDVIIKQNAKIPLELLEPLALIHSYTIELQKCRADCEKRQDNKEKESLDAHEIVLTRIKNKIYERLKQEHASASRQLAVIEEEIARLNVSLRIGESPLDLFLTQTDDLRKSRESLVRHIHNLIAWQNENAFFTTVDTFGVSLESLNESTFDINIPAPRMIISDKPLYIWYSEELRTLFEMRSALERRKAEWKHMVAENDYTAATVQEGLIESEAAILRNNAAIRFCHQRMEQIVIDCDADIKALSKYKEDVLARAAKKQISESNTQDILTAIETADTALVRMRALARQALSANSPVEVPEVSTTMIQRIRGTVFHNAFAADSILFAVSAVCIVIGLLMFTDSINSKTDWLSVLSTCTAIGITALAVVVDSRMRAPLVAVLWMLLLALLVGFVYSRTAFDQYLIFVQRDGGASVPLVNIRAWLIVMGAALSGAGTAIAVSNYYNFRSYFPIKMSVLIVFFSLFSAAAVAATHTAAPRSAVLVLEESRDIEPSGKNEILSSASRQQNTDGYLRTSDNTESMHKNDVDEPGSTDSSGVNTVNLLMQGVVYTGGESPLFKASLTHPDGSVENISLKLGDTIIGNWKAQEYNQYTKKLTISNGEKLLVLEAGKQVLLAMLPPDAE